MKKLLFPALVAAVALSACAPKHSDGHKDQAQKDQAKRPTVKTETVETKTNENKSVETKPVENKGVETKTVDTHTDAKTVDSKQDVTVQAPAEVKTEASGKNEVIASTVRADGKPEIFYGDFICKKEFPDRFAPFQKAFADAAKATDEALKAMKPVVERLDDSSVYHAHVKSSYLELTEAYKAMLKEFGTSFGCFYMLPKGGQITITSDTFKAEYKQLRARVKDMIGEPHLGPEVIEK